ncbi:hypothetical protein VARIO8X_100037 [Burkholderiales bacterium 8X]|nr:hypothetical protein VARIO8X_100037 [Burkholderiales bacterium 8X]
MRLLNSLLNGLASLFGLQARTALPPLPITQSSAARAAVSQADVLTRPGRLEPAAVSANAFPATMILRPGARSVPQTQAASAPAPIDPAVKAHAELRAHAQRLRANAKARQARDEAAAADSGFAATDFMDFPETVAFPRKKSRG